MPPLTERPPPADRRPATGEEDLRRALEAERAASAYWRETSERRRSELQRLRSRPAVRTALRLGRLLARLRRAAGGAERLILAGVDTTALVTTGVRTRADRAGRAGAVGAVLASLPHQPPGPAVRELTVPRPDEVHGSSATDLLRRAIEATDAELVCIRHPDVEPLDAAWLDRLAAAVRGEVVAATAHAVHPHRPLWRSTPHDGCTRELGFEVADEAGVPTLVSLAAGRPVQLVGDVEVAAATATAIVLRRAAVLAAGGLPADIDDADAALAELCFRLRRAGGRVVAVSDALVEDRRPVAGRRSLTRPVDPRSPAWRTVVERSGAGLLGFGTSRSARIAISTAVPSRRVTDRWGDWHLAEAFARSLRALGHGVRLQTADESDSLAGRACDVHVVLRGLHPVRRTTGQVHVLWVLSHPESLTSQECDDADLVCVASERFARELGGRTGTPVVVMQQATDHRRFRPVPPQGRHRHPITVVASSHDRVRGSVRTAIDAGLRPAIHGAGWDGLVGADLIAAGNVANDDLPAVYCSAGVVLNDHWGTMRAWGFVSNRLFDVLACGVPVISDHLDEVNALFEGTVPTYRDAAELRREVDRALDDPEAARATAARGREIVLASHTFDHRASELLMHLERFGLLD